MPPGVTSSDLVRDLPFRINSSLMQLLCSCTAFEGTIIIDRVVTKYHPHMMTQFVKLWLVCVESDFKFARAAKLPSGFI